MRIGSRGSRLALAQAEQVAKLLGGGEIVAIRTSGDEAGANDRIGTEAGAGAQMGNGAGTGAQMGTETRMGTKAVGVGDKSRWVDAIEQALLAGEIDLAVHSAKDVPGQLAPGLALVGAPSRAPVHDALCGAASLDALPMGARVGTSSLRRAAQLLATRPDLRVSSLKGNVDTRLGRLGGDLHAIVLARAGLRRLGREREIGAALDTETFVPSPGQGTLALEGRVDDQAARRAAQGITDAQTFLCLTAERALAAALGATCNTPLGAWCAPTDDGRLRLRAWVGLPDGSAWIADQLEGEEAEPQKLAAQLVERMRSVGADEMLAEAEAVAV
jgi:hydroxymethylbilane synthase